jgi:hypothetical protein
MKYQELTEEEKVNVKKHIKGELPVNPKVGDQLNPNQLEYQYKNGGLQISGKLRNMDTNQINSAVIRNVKDKLKKGV